MARCQRAKVCRRPSVKTMLCDVALRFCPIQERFKTRPSVDDGMDGKNRYGPLGSRWVGSVEPIVVASRWVLHPEKRNDLFRAALCMEVNHVLGTGNKVSVPEFARKRRCVCKRKEVRVQFKKR